MRVCVIGTIIAALAMTARRIGGRAANVVPMTGARGLSPDLSGL